VRLSIITINKNDAGGLRRTIRSVKERAPRNMEYIVIDGDSSDGSLLAIEDEGAIIDSWISEPDSGVYQAMNKGIARAKGDYCLFLNSGDVLSDGGLIDSVLGETEPGHDIYYADAALMYGGEHSVVKYPSEIDINFFISGMINHQNSIIRRQLFDEVGLFDESLKLSSDWFFFLSAAYSRKATFKYIGPPIVEFAVGGISSKPGSGDVIRKEREYCLSKVFGDLAPTILDLVELRDSVYGDTVRLFGRTRVLDFLIMSYRFFARRLKLTPRRGDADSRG
jgi:glycosyltransferase involved in cell wall biosynthesis